MTFEAALKQQDKELIFHCVTARRQFHPLDFCTAQPIGLL